MVRFSAPAERRFERIAYAVGVLSRAHPSGRAPHVYPDSGNHGPLWTPFRRVRSRLQAIGNRRLEWMRTGCVGVPLPGAPQHDGRALERSIASQPKSGTRGNLAWRRRVARRSSPT